MKRRSFIKNVSALVAVSAVGIPAALPKKKEDVKCNLILKSSEGEIKMNLIGIDLGPIPNVIVLDPLRRNVGTEDTIKVEAIILSEKGYVNLSEPMQFTFMPDKNTIYNSTGYITDWNVNFPKYAPAEVEFTFKISGSFINA